METNSGNEWAVEVEHGSGVHLNIVYGKGRACEPRERVDHGEF